MEFLWFLSQFRTSVLDNLFQLITFLGEETLLVVFICITYWCINKRMGYEMGFSFCIFGRKRKHQEDRKTYLREKGEFGI